HRQNHGHENYPIKTRSRFLRRNHRRRDIISSQSSRHSRLHHPHHHRRHRRRRRRQKKESRPLGNSPPHRLGLATHTTRRRRRLRTHLANHQSFLICPCSRSAGRRWICF